MNSFEEFHLRVGQNVFLELGGLKSMSDEFLEVVESVLRWNAKDAHDKWDVSYPCSLFERFVTLLLVIVSNSK